MKMWICSKPKTVVLAMRVEDAVSMINASSQDKVSPKDLQPISLAKARLIPLR